MHAPIASQCTMSSMTAPKASPGLNLAAHISGGIATSSGRTPSAGKDNPRPRERFDTAVLILAMGPPLICIAVITVAYYSCEAPARSAMGRSLQWSATTARRVRGHPVATIHLSISPAADQKRPYATDHSWLHTQRGDRAVCCEAGG